MADAHTMRERSIPQTITRLNTAAEYQNGGHGKVNSRTAGLVTVHQRDLKWLLKRHRDADSALERLEQAAAALLLDIDGGASISMNQHGKSWPAYQSIDALLEQRMALRRARRPPSTATVPASTTNSSVSTNA
jgi:hypothetical protein